MLTGRWLHRPPPPWHEHEAIGFDALGRVVCVREYDATGEVWLERFASGGATRSRSPASAPRWSAATASFPPSCSRVTRVRLAAGKPVESERYMPPTGSCTRERYRHEGGRLARVEEDSCDDGGGLATVVKEVVYGDDGRVAGIDALGPDGRQAVWRRGGQPHPARREARPSGGRRGCVVRSASEQ